jgi:hypothetical protein
VEARVRLFPSVLDAFRDVLEVGACDRERPPPTIGVWGMLKNSAWIVAALLLTNTAVAVYLLIVSGERTSVAPEAASSGATLVEVRVLDSGRRYLASSSRIEGRLSGRFQIVNPTHRSVKIALKGVSCGCTSVEVAGKNFTVDDAFSIAGGEKVEVALVVKSDGYAIKRRLVADFEATQAAVTEPVRIAWEYEVVASVEVEPSVLHVRLPGRSGAAAIPTIRNAGEVVVRRVGGAKDVEPVPPRMSGLPSGTQVDGWKLKDRSNTPENWIQERWGFDVSTIVAETPLTNSRRAYPATVVIESEKGEQESQSLSLIIHPGRGIVFPETIGFGSIATGQTVRRRVRLQSTIGMSFRVLSVSSHDPRVSGTVVPMDGNGRDVWLQLMARADSPGPLRGKVAVTTDHPDTESFEIIWTAIGVPAAMESSPQPR